MVGLEGEKVNLSLRHSHVKDDYLEDEEEEKGEEEGDFLEQCRSVRTTPPDSEIASLEDIREGMVVRGYVKAITNVGAFVQ